MRVNRTFLIVRYTFYEKIRQHVIILRRNNERIYNRIIEAVRTKYGVTYFVG